MDSDTIIARSNYLLDYELDYELAIRNTLTNRNVQDKRKILKRLLDKEKDIPGRKIDLDSYDFDFKVEEEGVNKSILSITEAVIDFEGTSSDGAFQRIISRIAHVMGRILRIPVPENNPGEVTNFKNESQATCLTLESDLFDKISQPSSTPNLNTTLAPTITVAAPPCSSKSSKPIADWDIKFSGESKSVFYFLERVTELAQARKVDDNELFESAVEFFVGNAFAWYRSIKGSVTDWASLVNLLKRDFLPADADEEVWDQIKARKQKKNESVAIYVAQMDTLFNRLSRPPAETTKVRYLKQNLNSEFLTQLALIDIVSVVQFSCLCRKLEENSYLKSKSAAVPSQVSEISIDSQCQSVDYVNDYSRSKLKNRNPNFSNKSSNSSTFNNNNKMRHKQHLNANNNNLCNNPNTAVVLRDPLKCWNCGQLNHTFSVCKARKKIFCYRCGNANVRVSNCPQCSKN